MYLIMCYMVNKLQNDIIVSFKMCVVNYIFRVFIILKNNTDRTIFVMNLTNAYTDDEENKTSFNRLLNQKLNQTSSG